MTTFFQGVLQPSNRWLTPNKLQPIAIDSKLLDDEHFIRIIESKQSSYPLEWLIRIEMLQNFHFQSSLAVNRVSQETFNVI